MSYDPHQPYSSYGPEGREEATPPPPLRGDYEPTQYAGPTQYGLPYDTPPPPPPAGSVRVTVNSSQYGVQYGLPPQPPRRSLRWLWITLAIVAGVVILACGSCVLVGVIAALTVNPDSTVNDYYSAIQQQNYSEAYSYLEVDTLAIQGQQISPTESGFALVAQVIDQQAGPVISYSITSSSTNGDTATVVVHVTRSSGVAYDVHLQLTKINSEWKITQLDNI
ncbi:MAG: DUF4878 domain-containing protein [Thermogemmatispora sp.]|jgi:hypothetical protein|uniref:Uncharacterized protein n=1 Tax=Thermogemmatispora aurantia TaxID=2045279 RepID=A0A5J4KDP3_9CHLR|nr:MULTISPECIES: DUF4878 domain-containing protein [Thermogemmatispora]MBE3565292.1 DUF4878 domain-containing protein [Thermogemmatispora sp.]GER85082.1 hypothetical protein KTAU_37180 [Thermogemmatispora aurantia]